MTKFVLEYLFIFITGAILGWCIEVVYRRYFGLAKKWINPGFLSGPFLPLYGTGICLLYIVSELPLLLGWKILCFAFITTTIEYVTGEFFLRVYNVRLWDYSKLRINFRGIICPMYSFFWTILSLVFYFLLYPYFYQQVQFLYENLEFSLFIGVLYGVIIVDVTNAFDVVHRLKRIADTLEGTLEEYRTAINYERLKREISERVHELPDIVEPLRRLRHRPTFFRPFTGDFNMRQYIQGHLEQLKEESKERIEQIRTTK